MDIDRLNSNVSKLMRFMERIEKQQVVSDKGAASGFVEAKHKELEERLKALGERMDTADLANMRDQLNALDDYKVQVVEPALKDISDLLPKMQGLGEMLTWFQENKANLEGAIALADAMDEPVGDDAGASTGTSGLGGGAPGTTETPVADPALGAGTADPGPQTGTGAVSGDPLPDAGLGTDASQAAADDAKLATDRPGGV